MISYIQTLNSNPFVLFIISLIATLTAINAIWIYIFVIYMKVSRNSPKITNSQKSTSLSPSSSSNLGARSENTNIPFSYKREVNLPSVSIIIPARNEESEIYGCLTSLLSQGYPNLEIVAIDDNSSDNTLQEMQKIRTEYCQNINVKSEDTSLGLQQSVNESQSNSSPIKVNNLFSEIPRGQKDNLTLTVSLQTPVCTITSNKNSEKEKLNIISLKDKPEDWAAKTWASQQGFLHSKGDIIIFTDADTRYIDKNVIFATISYLLKEKLDVLTGFPFIELRDFWSKAISPVWKLIGTIFGTNLD